MAKAKLITTAIDGNVVSFAIEGAGTINIDLAALSDEIRNRAMVHGIVQKVSDAAAIPKADLPNDPGEAARVKLDAMRAVADRLTDGEWSKRNGEGAGPVAGIIYRAFEEWALARAEAAKKALSANQVRLAYDAKDRAGQLALRNVPEIATIIERMKSERGGTSPLVDTAALLGELGID